MQGEQKFENNKAFQSYWLFERNCIRCKLYNAQWVTSRPYSTFKAKKKKFVHLFLIQTFIDFDFQFALEKRNGLPFASFMDPDQVKKASMQIGFIRFVLIPLFEALSKVFMITYADRKIFFFFSIVEPLRKFEFTELHFNEF